jgi:hypothetical protein
MYEHLDFTKLIVPFGIICALLGWCAIELLLWLFSFIEIALG